VELRWILPALGIAGLLGACRTGSGGELGLDAALVGGERRLASEEQWRGVAEQPVAGLSLHGSEEGLPASFEAALYYSEDETSLSPSGTAEGRIAEVQLGVRKELSLRRWIRPFAGLGLSVFDAERKLSSPNLGKSSVESEWDLGAYAHAGIRLDVTSHLFVEADYRLMRESEDVNADYDQVTLGLGWRF